MPLILGTNSIKETGYDVANSLRFNPASNDRLTRTPASAGNRNKWTWSGWAKRGTDDEDLVLFGLYQNSSYETHLKFALGGEIRFLEKYNGSANGKINTLAKFRDLVNWYHIVVVWDKDNSTSADKLIMYVNGLRITDFDGSAMPSNASNWNSDGLLHEIGALNGSSDMNGYICEVCFIDGQALAPTDFGEYDEDSPTIWKPKDVSGLTFGSNGFFLEFKQSGTGTNSSGMGADTSGNNHHFAVDNLTSVDQSIDTCTNNFATWNPLNRNTSMGSFHHGNLEYEVDATFFRTAFATFGATQGKWYFECKRVIGTSFSIGIISLDYKSRTPNVSYIGGAGDATNNIGYLKDGNTAIGGSETSGYASYGNGDTVMVAMDIDNGAVYFGVNGTWGNSGNPESGASKTGARSFTPSGEEWTFAVSVYDSHWEANFGSPMYAISSGNSDGDGFGNFEYAVPSGYYSLNTKNLAEYG